jgi:hypothetical protein
VPWRGRVEALEEESVEGGARMGLSQQGEKGESPAGGSNIYFVRKTSELKQMSCWALVYDLTAPLQRDVPSSSPDMAVVRFVLTSNLCDDEWKIASGLVDTARQSCGDVQRALWHTSSGRPGLLKK